MFGWGVLKSVCFWLPPDLHICDTDTSLDKTSDCYLVTFMTGKLIQLEKLFSRLVIIQ